jgi:hypothetical protein
MFIYIYMLTRKIATLAEALSDTPKIGNALETPSNVAVEPAANLIP